MTEDSYQAARKIMQKANYLRGIITARKGDVAKWSKMEDVNRSELRESQANGCKKMLAKAIERLNEAREKFEELKFPEHNLIIIKKQKIQCEGCGALVDIGNNYCNECLNIN